MAELLLLRHGESTFNAERRWAGQLDPPLTPRGEQQATEAAARLQGAGFEGVVASPLQRARRTAEIIASILGLNAPTVDERLIERGCGLWEGRNVEEISEQWPDEYEAWRSASGALAPPQGEPWDEFTCRIIAALDDLARQHDGDRLVLVAHAGLLRCIDHHFDLPRAEKLGNLTGRWIHLRDGSLSALAEPF